MDLLDRLGGREAVFALSDALYDRLLDDDELGVQFADAHMPTQRVRLAEYLVAAIAGSTAGAPARLRAAHAAQGVNDRHFSIMASHLADLLTELPIDEDAAADLLDLVAARRRDVVSDSHVAREWLPEDDLV